MTLLVDTIMDLCLYFRLNPNPLLLFGHFFAVVVYAVYVELRTRSIWQLPLSVFQSVCIFLRACDILFPLVWSELRTVILF